METLRKSGRTDWLAVSTPGSSPCSLCPCTGRLLCRALLSIIPPHLPPPTLPDGVERSLSSTRTSCSPPGPWQAAWQPCAHLSHSPLGAGTASSSFVSSRLGQGLASAWSLRELDAHPPVQSLCAAVGQGGSWRAAAWFGDETGQRGKSTSPGSPRK